MLLKARQNYLEAYYTVLIRGSLNEHVDVGVMGGGGGGSIQAW